MSEKTGAAKANVKAKLKSLSTRWFDFAAKVVEFIDKSVEPALKRFFKGLATFYKNRIHPILAVTASPEKRAIAAGRYLCRLAVTYAILSIIGAIILVTIVTYFAAAQLNLALGVSPSFRWISIDEIKVFSFILLAGALSSLIPAIMVFRKNLHQTLS